VKNLLTVRILNDGREQLNLPRPWRSLFTEIRLSHVVVVEQRIGGVFQHDLA
jgi:hypothetical protein